MRNTVGVTVDSLRADHVAHLGHPRDTTPMVGWIADHDVTFYRAIANARSTISSFSSIRISVYGQMYDGHEHVGDKEIIVAWLETLPDDQFSDIYVKMGDIGYIEIDKSVDKWFGRIRMQGVIPI